MAAINTDQQLEQEMANLAGGVGGENIPQVTAVRPTVKDGEIQDATGAKIADANVSAIATTPTQVMPTTPTGTLDWYVKWIAMILAVIGVFSISANFVQIGQIAYILSSMGWVFVGMQWGDRAIMIGSSISGTAVAMNLVSSLSL